MTGIVQDVRHALRMHRRAPLPGLAAVAALALGIGANTAAFSFADSLLLRPLPVRDPARLVSLLHVQAPALTNYSSFSYPDYVELRDGNDVFSGLAAWSTIEVRVGTETPTSTTAQIVSGNYFDVLGIVPARGRLLQNADDLPGAPPAAVLSDRFWRRSLAGAPDVVGDRISINGQPFTVAGVAPPAFTGLDLHVAPDLWVPLASYGVAMPDFRAFGTDLFWNRGTHWVDVFGRLGPDVTTERAEAAMRVLADGQASAHPETNRDWTIRLTGLDDARLGPPGDHAVVNLTVLILIVVGVVLIIACANVANILLARGVARRREMAIRLAVGANRRRLMRQLMVEGLLLAGLGGALGAAVATAGLAWMRGAEMLAAVPGAQPQLDLRVLAFTGVVSLVLGIAFGLAPALQASKRGFTSALQAGRLRQHGSSGRVPAGRVLIVAQVALCLLLLIGAGLTLRTVMNLRAVPLGFDTRDLWTAAVDVSAEPVPDERRRDLLLDLVRRVRALPGVESADLALITPFSPRRMANDIFWLPDDQATERSKTNVDMNIVGASYFETMQIPIVRGRAFGNDDSGSAIVNETLAARLWPGQDPIGKPVWSWNPDGPDRALQVVGVAQDGRYHRGWRNADRPFLFVPFAGWSLPAVSLHVRSRSGPGIGTEISRELAALAPSALPPQMQSVRAAFSTSIALEQTTARLFGLFALLAVTIAAVGIYGVVSFLVSQRTAEMGLRLALGATRAAIVRHVLRDGLQPVLIGIAVGWAAAIALGRLVSSLLFEIRPTDPTTFLLVALFLLGIGTLASYVPARRATRVDPLTTLRSE